jgi:hypothetical protein
LVLQHGKKEIPTKHTKKIEKLWKFRNLTFEEKSLNVKKIWLVSTYILSESLQIEGFMC